MVRLLAPEWFVYSLVATTEASACPRALWAHIVTGQVIVAPTTRAILQKLTVIQRLRTFTEKDSPPRSKEATSGQCPESAECNPLASDCYFKIHYNIIHPYAPGYLSGFSDWSSIHSSYVLPFMQHARLSRSFLI
jgi:hypothetical protein